MKRLFFHALDRICILSMRTFLRDRFCEIDRARTDRELAKQSQRPDDLFGEPVEPFDLDAAASDEPDCRGLRYRKLCFASPHARRAAEGDSDESRIGHPNGTVAVHLLCPPGKPIAPRRVLVALHGYRQASWKLFFLPFARFFARHGWSTAVMELPHHLSRREPGCKNGEMMICANPVDTLRAISQAVVDARTLSAAFRRAGSEQVGVVGVSLGGLVAALMGVVEPDLDHLILIAPTVDPADVLWNSGLLDDKRRAVEMAGYDEQDVWRMVRPITPGLYEPAVSAQNVMVFQSRYDLIARPRTIDRLCEKWGIEQRRTLGTGHFLLAILSGLLRPAILKFLQRERSPGLARSIGSARNGASSGAGSYA